MDISYHLINFKGFKTKFMLSYQEAFPRIMLQSFNNISVNPPFQKFFNTSSIKINSKKVHKFKFTKEEDEKLCLLVKRYDENNWAAVSKNMKNRNPRQCRERWKNYMNPQLSKNEWTEEDDMFLLKKYQEIGPHWNKITQQFQNRSINSVRNRFVKLSKSIKYRNFNFQNMNLNKICQVKSDPNKILQQNDLQEYIPANFIYPEQPLINFPINSFQLHQNSEKRIKDSQLFSIQNQFSKADDKKESSESKDLLDIFWVQTNEIGSLDSLSCVDY